MARGGDTSPGRLPRVATETPVSGAWRLGRPGWPAPFYVPSPASRVRFFALARFEEFWESCYIVFFVRI